MGGNPSRILPGLYLGGANSLDGSFLAKAGVTHVLSVCCDARPSPDVQGTLQGHLHIPIEDLPSADMQPHFEPCVRFIHDCRTKGGCCYVHCMAGISRSTTIVCAYLMAALRLPFPAALGFVQRRREIALPNAGFQRQLRALEADGLAELAARITADFPSDLPEGDLAEVRDSGCLAAPGVRDVEAQKGEIRALLAQSDDHDRPDVGLQWVHSDEAPDPATPPAAAPPPTPPAPPATPEGQAYAAAVLKLQVRPVLPA